MNVRKSLKPINSDQYIDVLQIQPRRTRSKLDKVTDENNINPIIKQTRVTNLQKVKFKSNDTKEYVRSRLNSSSTASTESIPDCKSLTHLENIDSNIYSFEENTNYSLSSKKTQVPSQPDFISTPDFYPIPNLLKNKTFSEKISVPIWKKIPKPKSKITRSNSSFNCKIKENLSDEIFIRRHEKYEICEKKVEKDMQKNYKQNRKILKSFDEQHYVPSDLQKKKWKNVLPKTFESEISEYDILITDKVPLRAFGVKLPVFEEEPFKLLGLQK